MLPKQDEQLPTAETSASVVDSLAAPCALPAPGGAILRVRQHRAIANLSGRPLVGRGQRSTLHRITVKLYIDL